MEDDRDRYPEQAAEDAGHPNLRHIPAKAQVQARKGKAAFVENFPAALDAAGDLGETADGDDEGKVQDQRPTHPRDDPDLEKTENNERSGQVTTHALGMARTPSSC